MYSHGEGFFTNFLPEGCGTCHFKFYTFNENLKKKNMWDITTGNTEYRTVRILVKPSRSKFSPFSNAYHCSRKISEISLKSLKMEFKGDCDPGSYFLQGY